MTEETTVDKGQAIAFGMQGYGLAQTGCIVLDGDILQGNLATLNLQREGAEGSNFFVFSLSCQRGDVCPDVSMVVPGDDGLVAILTTNLDVGKPLGYNEFLLIGAVFHVNHLVILHESTAHLDGIGDVPELTRPVARHKQGVWIVITLGLYAHDSHEGTDDTD